MFIFLDFTILDGVFLLCASLLVITGVLDDKYGLSVKFRLVVQSIVSLLLTFISDVNLTNLGSLFSDFPILISGNSIYLITTLAVIGSINAFYMIDGIDGLLGLTSLVAFISLATMLTLAGNLELAVVCMLFVFALIPFVIMNIGLIFGLRFKVFMGDAGSMLIGFAIVFLLITSSQQQEISAIGPVTALWFIAIPLMDMTTVMLRRIFKGQSPFLSDRQHLHHIFLQLGFTSHITLVIIFTLSTLAAVFGIIGEIYVIKEKSMFLLFVCFFVLHFIVTNYICHFRLDGENKKVKAI